MTTTRQTQTRPAEAIRQGRLPPLTREDRRLDRGEQRRTRWILWARPPTAIPGPALAPVDSRQCVTLWSLTPLAPHSPQLRMSACSRALARQHPIGPGRPCLISERLPRLVVASDDTRPSDLPRPPIRHRPTTPTAIASAQRPLWSMSHLKHGTVTTETLGPSRVTRSGSLETSCSDTMPGLPTRLGAHRSCHRLRGTLPIEARRRHLLRHARVTHSSPDTPPNNSGPSLMVTGPAGTARLTQTGVVGSSGTPVCRRPGILTPSCCSRPRPVTVAASRRNRRAEPRLPPPVARLGCDRRPRNSPGRRGRGRPRSTRGSSLSRAPCGEPGSLPAAVAARRRLRGFATPRRRS